VAGDVRQVSVALPSAMLGLVETGELGEVRRDPNFEKESTPSQSVAAALMATRPLDGLAARLIGGRAGEARSLNPLREGGTEGLHFGDHRDGDHCDRVIEYQPPSLSPSFLSADSGVFGSRSACGLSCSSQ
jgi:hypothetical protein